MHLNESLPGLRDDVSGRRAVLHARWKSAALAVRDRLRSRSPVGNDAAVRRRDLDDARSRADDSRRYLKPLLTHFNLVGKTLQGRYEIVKKVGEGGMSFVYLATDVATREKYAIKVLSAALSQDARCYAPAGLSRWR